MWTIVKMYCTQVQSKLGLCLEICFLNPVLNVLKIYIRGKECDPNPLPMAVVNDSLGVMFDTTSYRRPLDVPKVSVLGLLAFNFSHAELSQTPHIYVQR